MSLFGGIEMPNRPCLENVRRLDLLPIPFIRRSNRIGFAIDRPHFPALGSQFRSEMNDLAKDISSYIPYDRLLEFSNKEFDDLADTGAMNVGSAEQVGKLLFDMLDIASEDLKRTATGKVSTGKKQLETIRLRHPVVPKVLRHRQLNTLVTKYCNSLPKLAKFHPKGDDCPVCELSHRSESWRIHGEMGTTRADTGRINHKNPNLGNIPTRSEDGQAVQAGFIAPDGMRLVTRDLSQIELRDLAHLANATSMIKVYEARGDIHDMVARKVFRLPDDVKPDKYKHRMAAKRCIAKGQRVLTNHGLIPIEKVTCCDLVWDGIEWVSHDGVVSNGILPTIEHDGVRCTLDHVVWTLSGEMLYASEAKRRDARLAITGVAENPVRYTLDNKFQHLQKLKRVSDSDSVLLSLRECLQSACRQYRERQYQNVPLPSSSEVQQRRGTSLSGSLPSYRTTLLKSEQRIISELWRARDKEQVQRRATLSEVLPDFLASSDLQQAAYREEEQRRELRTWEPKTRERSLKSKKQTNESLGDVQRRARHRQRSAYSFAEGLPGFQTWDKAHVQAGCCGGSMAFDIETQGSWAIQETEVFDIVNAGPRHRFTVENHLVANTSFGIQNGTTEKGLYLQLIMDYGENKMPIPDWLTEEWCKDFIRKWLAEFNEVVEWFDVQHFHARRYGMVWEPFGRVKLIPEVQSTHVWIKHSGLRQAQNFPVTSLAAAQLKLAMGRADAFFARVRETGVWCWPLLTIHDCIKAEVEEDAAEDVLEGLGEECLDSCMDDERGVCQLRVPVESDGHVSERWV